MRRSLEREIDGLRLKDYASRHAVEQVAKELLALRNEVHALVLMIRRSQSLMLRMIDDPECKAYAKAIRAEFAFSKTNPR